MRRIDKTALLPAGAHRSQAKHTCVKCCCYAAACLHPQAGITLDRIPPDCFLQIIKVDFVFNRPVGDVRRGKLYFF